MTTNGSGHDAQVHRAEGVVSVHADCTIAEARIKMDERAQLLDCTLRDLAAGIVGHRIWFSAH
jgi:hypothetical protein